MISPERIQTLTEDKRAFDAAVYTTYSDALKELESRKNDAALTAYVEKQLPLGVPEIMREKKSLVLFRHIATPNYEINRFIALGEAIEPLQTLILEYTQDKFNDRNEAKYFLGKLRFHKGTSKNGSAVFENEGVINFNESGNLPLSSVLTHWGQSLVDFHHELFASHYVNRSKVETFDLSDWLRGCGGSAKTYYKPFLSLFLQNGILFENFLVDAKEKSFVEEVILPAFLEIEEESGYKPLIVPLAPTEIESDEFWYSYPHHMKGKVEGKMTEKGG